MPTITGFVGIALPTICSTLEKILIPKNINMKLPVYGQAVLAACSLGLLLLPLGCYQVSVSFEPSDLDTSSPPPTQTQQPKADPSLSAEKATTSGVSNPTPTTANPQEISTKESSILTSSHNSGDKAAHQGTLRMSNQTQQPVRLALLARRSVAKSSGQTNYDIPAHWDFAPKEGSEKGLLLSLPKGNLKLEKGDILVAFAQDGSRRYWGPYVVGETSSPTWNPQKAEWKLVLSP